MVSYFFASSKKVAKISYREGARLLESVDHDPLESSFVFELGLFLQDVG